MRRELERRERDAQPKRLAYADPPYPGCAWMYRDQPSYAGEVDHPALIASLVDAYDGWALSTSAAAVRELLPLCPPAAFLAIWHKPGAAQSTTRGKHNVYECVIVMPARELRPGVPDVLRALPARGGGNLIGRKPLRFCAWLFRLLGALPGDSFADLFPGSGVVGRAWQAYASQPSRGDASSRSSGDTSLRTSADASPAGMSDVSPGAGADVSPEACSDGSSDALRAAAGDVSREYSADASESCSGDGSELCGPCECGCSFTAHVHGAGTAWQFVGCCLELCPCDDYQPKQEPKPRRG